MCPEAFPRCKICKLHAVLSQNIVPSGVTVDVSLARAVDVLHHYFNSLGLASIMMEKREKKIKGREYHNP